MNDGADRRHEPSKVRFGCWAIVAASGLLGLGLIADQAYRLSATYDEVTYLEVGAKWWRTSEQRTITRMGSPLTFWKIQQIPTLWLIDHFGDRSWIDEPIEHQARLLPLIRIGGSWIWLAALGLVAVWSRSWYGDRAMALAAMIFAFSPNLLAHGALCTMEMPLVATSSAMVFAFARFLQGGRRGWLWASASVGGLAFSCKFTTVLIPPILGAIWAVDLWRRRDPARPRWPQGVRALKTLVGGMVGYGAILVLSNLLVTGFATISLSPRTGSHPVLDSRLGPTVAAWASTILEAEYPQDWVGFARQVILQKGGGPSYLFGERRSSGWWYYYLVAMAVKVPLGFWLLAAVRSRFRPGDDRQGWIIAVYVSLFLAAALVGSKRNYGVRYLLPLAPPAIVWVSALANSGWGLRLARRAGLVAMGVAVGSIHPYELSYFNLITGGAEGGRRILSDSNLDWGQGARSMARLQATQPRFRDLTWFYFGDTNPAWYGVVGPCYQFDAHRSPEGLPDRLSASTAYLAVSASLQWGPWGPSGYFAALDKLRPVKYSADMTVAIYRTADLVAVDPIKTGPDPE